MDKKVRIGIMGGTFNPIHLGHLITGECAYQQYDLKQVLFMPTKTPPHKSLTDIASAEDRACMVSLAIEDNPHFALSRMEIERNGTTYTVDTLRELAKSHDEYEYYFIIGADSLFDFEKWREPAEILRLSHILVASRYGLGNEKLIEQIEHLKSLFGGSFDIVEIPTIGISSSEIRKDRKAGQSVRYVVDEKVRSYMNGHGLYR